MNENETPKLVNISNGQTVEICSDKFSVGRSLKCSYVLDSVFISRIHFVVEKTGDSWILRDNSSNGTIVNDEKISVGRTVNLKDGDVIKFISTDTSFRFQHSPSHEEELQMSLTDEQLCEVLDSVVSKEINDHNILNDHCYEIQSNEPQLVCVNEVVIPSEGSSTSDININLIHPTTSFDGETSSERKRSSSLDLPLPSKTDESPNKKNKPDPLESDAEVKVENKQVEVKSETEKQNEMIEEEMQCSICSELFIKAVTLNCCHTFCKFCIEEWRKQQNFCPICRNKILSMAPTLVLDNFIEKHISQMDEETKRHRKEMVEYRTSLNMTLKTSAPSTSKMQPVNSATSSSAATSSITISTTVSISSDDDEEEDEYDDEDYDYSDDEYDPFHDYNGVPGKYYGGYGRCYNCNRRGHWANGCPYR